MPTIAGIHQDLGEGCGKDAPSKPPVEINLADTLILDFSSPELRENKFVVLSYKVCGNL